MNLTLIKKISIVSIALMVSLSTTLVGADTTFTRLGGENRFETAVAISKHGWKSSDYVILASGLNSQDAASVAVLSKKYDAPALLTNIDVLNTNTNTEITRLGAKHVLILGGSDGISDNVENALTDKGLAVTRFDGIDKYTTSVAIARQLGKVSEVIIASGEDFPDSVSIAPVAGIKNIPILLVSKETVSQDVLDYLKTQDITKTYIIGSSAVISDKVASNFTNTERIFGSNRYTTDIAIINKFKSVFNLNTFYTTSGSDFQDSFGGIALAVKTSSPIVLLNNIGNAEMREMLKTMKSSKDVVIGAEGTTPTPNVNELFSAPIPTAVPAPPKAVAANTEDLVYGSPVMATMNFSAGGFLAKENVEVVKDYNNGTTYLIYKNGKYATVSSGTISISANPATNSVGLSDEAIVHYANSHAFASSTKYYIWVDLARQEVYVLAGTTGNWSVYKTFPCATGLNRTPTIRGHFTVNFQQSVIGIPGTAVGLNGREFYPQYYIHSILSLPWGGYDYTIGKRASHGCIRVPLADSLWVFNSVPSGTALWVN